MISAVPVVTEIPLPRLLQSLQANTSPVYVEEAANMSTCLLPGLIVAGVVGRLANANLVDRRRIKKKQNGLLHIISNLI